MTDDLQQIFKDEVAGYLTILNEHLLQLELEQDTNDPAAYQQMQRLAHSMKGAARVVGQHQIETISHYMEVIFEGLWAQQATLSPDRVDTLYDSLDLVQQLIDDHSPPDDLLASVIQSLEALVAITQSDHHGDALNSASNEFPAFIETALSDADNADETHELVNIFGLEVREYLTKLHDGLLKLESLTDTARDKHIQEMNRFVHSMKGAAHAMDYAIIAAISHYLEEIFSASLIDKLDLTPQVVDVIYDGLDLIESQLKGDGEAQEVIAAVLMQLHRLADLDEQFSIPPITVETPQNQTLLTTTLQTGKVSSQPTMIFQSSEETLRVSVNKLDELMAASSELLVAQMRSGEQQRRLVRLRQKQSQWQREWRSIRATYIRLARRLQDEQTPLSQELNVLVKFLETNQRYLSETHRELTQLQQSMAQDNLQLSSLADELQADVSRLRMMPFETIVGSFQRLARDLARDAGKQVHLDIIGTAVEIDKTVLDALTDPLMHLLRNAIDHGLETPSEREAVGKAATGQVCIAVEQRGSEIQIEVSDDGRGIDLARIRQLAVERGVLEARAARDLSDDDAKMLIFQSGFTTTDSVTAISGRGLGMEIVRNRVEGLRGRIGIQTQLEAGTRFTLNVPVSLTRIRAVLLRVGDEQYALPSVMATRMETLATSSIFTAENHEMVVVGERPLPLVSLAALLGVSSPTKRGEQVKVVAIETTERAIAFEVDQLFSEIELVLKPLGRELQNAPLVAGAALLGSGEIIITLDANDLVRHALGHTFLTARPSTPQPPTKRRTKILVVDDSITTRTLEKNILDAAGFDVSVAVDGVEAWALLPDLEPDVVVCDVEMPNMNGFQLTERIRTTPHTQNLPVILLTSLSKPEQRETGLRVGANAYLVKSQFDQNELLSVIESVL